MKNKKKITVVLVDRANYGRLKPVMEEMYRHPEIDMQLVCSGTMLLDRFGLAKNVVISDGFKIDEEVYMELEGSVPSTMAKSLGLGVIEFASAFQRLSPDFVMVIGDRYEALSAAIAAVYQNICLIHLQGGEVTGSIDELARHSITKLAHYHFPATQRSGRFVIAMGENPETVFPLGCPSIDVIENSSKEIPVKLLSSIGVGASIDFSKPYILVLFHPVTTEFGTAEQQMQEILDALKEINMQVVLLWPNIDADSDSVSQAIRRFREFNRDFSLRAYKNFKPEYYIPLLANSACAVGNSSSFIREGAYLGTPVVLVGSRQDGREWGCSVKRVDTCKGEVVEAIKNHLNNGRYSSSSIYGTPGVSKRMVDTLLNIKPYSQKRLFYDEVQYGQM